jgi:hypothetical protein
MECGSTSVTHFGRLGLIGKLVFGKNLQRNITSTTTKECTTKVVKPMRITKKT